MDQVAAPGYDQRVKLKETGIKTSDKGEADYIQLRTQWDRFITLLAPKFAYDMAEIDTAMAKVKE